ncbi:DUF6497 family protein [Frigidibacter oleivorans]|uniref:DUF6497 family protein n=1 Tax=Frigidibacter oleivorans TaxID=2487129 RepID=UPI001F47E2EA|nr:DUF6497 family protein [Frigidibacter oleivorans]
MRRTLPLCLPMLAAMLVAGPARAEEIRLPSGLAVSWIETVQDAAGPEGLTARFRFLAPAITASMDFDSLAADMQWLCDSFALPRIPSTGPQPQQIVISLSDREIPFGETAPDAVQFFEAYRPAEGSCEWEMF